MILANNSWIENARGRSQGVDGGINSYLGECSRKNGCRIEVGERRSRGWIGQVVRGT